MILVRNSRSRQHITILLCFILAVLLYLQLHNKFFLRLSSNASNAVQKELSGGKVDHVTSTWIPSKKLRVIEGDDDFQVPFSKYVGCGNVVGVPTWVISSPNASHIHRFFDSSPFSSSGQYFVMTRIFNNEYTKPEVGDMAEIVVVNLRNGIETTVAKTAAWGTQLGAQAQWGKTDNELFYNVIKYEKKLQRDIPVGVIHNIMTSTKRYLECSIYHISPDGRYALSPDLTKIKFTQLGYGVDIDNAKKNINSPDNDGIYITDIFTGECKLLITLKKLSKIAGLDTKSTPTYGFHTKWSSDGQLIMIVMRRLVRKTYSTMTAKLYSYIEKYNYYRSGHLFVMSRDGQFVKYIMNWPDPRFIYGVSKLSANQTHSHTCDDHILPPQQYERISDKILHNIKSRDGNHPNWIPNTYKISINLKPFVSNGRDKFAIVIYDLDFDQDFQRYRYHQTDMAANITPHVPFPSCSYPDSTIYCHNHHANQCQVLEYQVYDRGSGHPNFAPYDNGRYAVLDIYEKQVNGFGGLEKDCAPLRLIDTWTKEEVWLKQVQIIPSDPYKNNDLSALPMSWRCDMHPAWSRDFKWLALNARPFSNGHQRGVLIAYVGSSLSGYFGNKREFEHINKI